MIDTVLMLFVDEFGAVLLFGIGEVFMRNLQTYLPTLVPQYEHKEATSAMSSSSTSIARSVLSGVNG